MRASMHPGRMNGTSPCASRQPHGAARRRPALLVVHGPRLGAAAVAAAAGAHPASAAPSTPSPAATARTVLDLCVGGTFCTVMEDATPVGTPVAYVLDKAGTPIVQLPPNGLELRNIARNPRCSLKVQPTAYPARALASVTLMGTLQPQPVEPGGSAYALSVDKCLYHGGLDQVGAARSLQGARSSRQHAAPHAHAATLQAATLRPPAALRRYKPS